MALPYDAVEQIRRDGSALVKMLAHHDPTSAVPSCPGWSLADLGWHVGEAWYFWSAVVERRIADAGELRTIGRPIRVDGPALLDFVYATHVRMCDALHATPSDVPVWTWTGANRDVGWVGRRLTQEIAVHRWDAANAVGDRFVVPAEVAADGIDEFLTWFAAGERVEGAHKVGGTVHLHCTDTGDGAGRPGVNGEWFVAAMKEPGATFSREHRRADAAVRGTARDLLLWLWRRDAGPVEILGDEAVARRFRAFTDLT